MSFIPASHVVRRRASVVACAASLAAAVAAQEEPTHTVDVAEHLSVPAGLELTLVAESPLLYNPTAMDVDARGRLWVTEAIDYRRWNGRNPGFDIPGGDRVVILEDTDGDGIYDESKVFVQEDALVSPLGIAVIGDEVWVSCSPDLIVYTDRDHDDKPDRPGGRRVALTGFGGPDHDHGLHSVVAGPDGRLYAAVGNAGPHLVTDSDGWSLRSGSLYTGGGQFTADNKPGLVSDDGRAWTGGLVLRFEPDGSDLTVLAHNFRNNYEVAVDSLGDLYQSDNDDDGNQGCRFLWCLEGGDHGYFSADGSRYWTADRRPGQSTQTAHWHQDDPGVVPAGAITGAGGPTGVAVYEGFLLARWIAGDVLATDAGAGVLYAFDVTDDGGGKALTTSVLVGAREGDETRDATWFRPSDVVVDVDGSLLIADWFDPGVGGHAMGDRETYGRILRLAPTGHRRFTRTLDTSTAEGAVATLNGPAVNVREAGRRALAERLADPARRDSAWEPLLGLARQGEPRSRARALQLLAEAGEAGRREVAEALDDPDPAVRVAAFRALRAQAERAAHATRGPATGDPDDARSAGAGPGSTGRRPVPRVVLELAARLADDPAPAVRREVAVALRDAPWTACEETLVTLCGRLDPDDRHGLEALGLAADGKEAALWARLLADAGESADPARWDARLARLAWRLHPADAVPLLAARAAHADVPLEQRRLALDALAFAPGREAAESVLALAVAGPDDLRDAARWWVDFRAGNDWRGFGLAEQLQPSGVDAAEVAWRSDVVRHGSVDVDVDLTGASVVWLVADDAGDGKGCDWVDWLEPRLTGPAGTTELVDAEWIEATTGWGSVRRGQDCEGGPLAVDGVVFAEGIGTHAPTRIGFRVPAGHDRLTARAAVDDGGTRQGGSPTSVRFEVRVERAPSGERLAPLRATLLDPAADEDARDDAALALAEDLDGAHVILALAAQGAFDDGAARGHDATSGASDAGASSVEPGALAAYAETVAEALYRHPDYAVRALASERFPRPAADGAALPPVEELLALDGDPVRGRDVFLAPSTQCATCHAVTRDGVRRGGDIGPELTAIREKYARPELLDAILNPNAGIAFGYDTWSWENADGRVVTGFLLAEDAERLVVKDTRGVRQVLDATSVTAKRKHALSTMPEGLALGMSPQDLADLLAFLAEDPDAPLRRGEPIVLFDESTPEIWGRGAWGVEGWTMHTDETGVKAADAWSLRDGVLHCTGRPVGYLRTVERFTNFVLDLEWRFLPEVGAGNSGVLLRVIGEDEVWPRSVEVQLHSGNAGDLWNIGAFDVEVDPARTNGRRTTRLQPSSEKPLGAWNHATITVDRGRLEVVVNGVLQNTAAWAAEVPGHVALQSEGALIQFRDVVLTPLLRE